MGLDISAKGLSYDETYHCGYITFGNYRMKVASAYNEELGEIYAKPYKNMLRFTRHSDSDIARWNEICNDDLDIFLHHSDCGGKLTPKECKAIYNAMKDLKVDFLGHNYGTMKQYTMHELWLNMFKHCYERRVNMYFH